MIVYGMSDEKGDSDYYLDAIRDFWVEMDLDYDELELVQILEWFDKRRGFSLDIVVDRVEKLEKENVKLRMQCEDLQDEIRLHDKT